MVRCSADRAGKVRRLLLWGCASVALAAGMATGVVADESTDIPIAESGQMHEFNVPPQSLHSALNQWSMMTGKDWGHIGASLTQIHTKGARGQFTDHEALAHILSGTGYTFNAVGAGAVSIVPVQADETVAEAEPTTGTPAKDNRPIETIVVRGVTAQRREQDIQDVPLAVSAFNGDLISQRQIVSTVDLGRNIVNLVSSNNVGLGTSVAYFMRGVGSTESIATFDLPVGTYVDEVYISRQNANQMRLSGVERVEVLRGPQGTLFGRNTTGGAVSIISQKPDAEFDAGAEVGYGSYDRLIASAYANIPVANNLYGRISGFVVNEDGFMENTLNDETFNGEKTWGVRGALRILPYDNVTWDVSVQYIESDYLQIGTPGIINLIDPGPPAVTEGTGVPVTGDLRTVRLTDRECEPWSEHTVWPLEGCHFNSAEAFLTISNLQFEFGAGTLNLITGYYDLEQRINLDVLGNTNQPIFGGVLGSNFYISNLGMHSQVSQEVKWTGALMDGRLAYVSGFFFMQEDNETFFSDTIFPPFLPGALILADRTPLANDTTSIAFYTQFDFRLFEDLNLQAGVRWTEEDKDISLDGIAFNFGTFSYVPLDDAALDAAGIPRHQNASRWTPRVALSYDITEDHMVYASFTQGFKSGGWNARSTTAIELQPFGPETVDSWEIGARTEWFDNHLIANLTLFRAIYDNFQLPTAFGSAFLTLNSGKAVVDGLELEVVAKVMETLDLYGSLGLMDAGYDSVSPGAIAAGILPDASLAHTPDVTAIIGFVKNFPLANNHLLQLTSDLKYTSKYDSLAANMPEGKVDETLLLNAQFSWTLPNEHWKLIAECKNCTDENYIRQSLFNVLYPADPRRWGIRVQYRY